MASAIKTFNPFGAELDAHTRLDNSNITVAEAEKRASAAPAPRSAPRKSKGVLDFAIPGLSKHGASDPGQVMAEVGAQQGLEGAPPAQPGQPSPDQGDAHRELPRLVMPPEPLPEPGVVTIATPAALDALRPMLGRLFRAATAKGGVPERAQRRPISLEDPQLHPLTLDTMITAFYGTAWYAWEAETFASMCNDLAAFGTPMSEENRAKAQAMAILHVTNHPWIDETVFSGVAEALNGVDPDFGTLKPVQPEHAVFALRLMAATAPQYQPSDRVAKFVAASCVHAGLLVFPDPQYSAVVSGIMRRMVRAGVSDDEFSDVENAWNGFVANGGLALPPESVEQLSEEHLADRQVVTGYWIANYVLEQERLLSMQLDQLAAWAQNEV